MPSIGFGEIVLILLLALIIFGPRRLPEMGRTVGRSLKEFRRAAADLRAELDVELEEEPLAGVNLEEEPLASVEERADRLAEHDKARSAEPSRGEAPPT